MQMLRKKNSQPIKKKCEIRSARKSDSAKIQRILANYAEKKLLLPRTKEDIERNISSFKVAEKNGKIVACCAANDYGNGLFEIRSLAVVRYLNGKGIGTALVERWIKTLKRRCSVKRIFALTYRPALFARLGFETVSKNLFPEKIWSDCAICPKKENCDEIAVLFKI